MGHWFTLRGSAPLAEASASPGEANARLNRNYDCWTVDIMDRVLRDDSNAIDVGCHQGSILQEIVRRALGGTHHQGVRATNRRE